MTAASVIAANLGHLQHPEGHIVSIPGFDRHLPDELAEAHGKLADLIGEAVIGTLEANGYIVTTPDRVKPDEEPEPWLTTRCNRCRHQLFRLLTANPDHVIADTRQLAAALNKHNEECR